MDMVERRRQYDVIEYLAEHTEGPLSTYLRSNVGRHAQV